MRRVCFFQLILTSLSGNLTTLEMRTGNCFGNAKTSILKKIGNLLDPTGMSFPVIFLMYWDWSFTKLRSPFTAALLCCAISGGT